MLENTDICKKHGRWGAVLYHRSDGCGICSLEERHNEIKDKLYNKSLSLRPKIVCLCGSTRFYNAYKKANFDLTMKGIIVLSVGFYHHLKDGEHNRKNVTKDEKRMLDELHKRKIDIADEIFVLNVGGYIGESTKSEIEYADKHNKKIRYLNNI